MAIIANYQKEIAKLRKMVDEQQVTAGSSHSGQKDDA